MPVNVIVKKYVYVKIIVKELVEHHYMSKHCVQKKGFFRNAKAATISAIFCQLISTAWYIGDLALTTSLIRAVSGKLYLPRK